MCRINGFGMLDIFSFVALVIANGILMGWWWDDYDDDGMGSYLLIIIILRVDLNSS